MCQCTVSVFLIISLPSNYFSIFHHFQWRNSQFPPSTLFISGKLWFCVFFSFLTSHALLKLHMLDCGLCSRLCCGSTPPASRARAAMPFGCLTLGEKKDYNNPSEVTDKYDLGQIVKSWVNLCCGFDMRNRKQKLRCVCVEVHCKSSFPQRGILWDIPGEGSEHFENVHL